MILAAAVLMGATPLQAFATETKIGYLPEVELGEDVLENDVFYLGSTTGILEENAHAVYLLKVGRGGEAESESTALVKITALLREVTSYLQQAVSFNVNDMLQIAFRNTRVEMTPHERNQFYDKHIRGMRLVVDQQGNASVELNR